MSDSNYLKNIAITGASGNSGSFMVKSLLEAGKHTITSITRPDSTSKAPEGVTVKAVDYSDHDALVDALKGQDALVITLSPFAPRDTQTKLIDAAGAAGVRYIMPNEWAPDISSDDVRATVSSFEGTKKVRDYILQQGKTPYIALTCGFWYEWSVSIPPAFGFDIPAKKATFYDDGNAKLSTSTWPQCGRTVAAILSLPVTSTSGASLEKFRNKNVFANSFTLSQREMLDSIFRVTGDKESDWTITHEPARERVAKAQDAMKGGFDYAAFVKVMYTRIFYDDGVGDFEKNQGLSNAELGLPKEDLDEATAAAVQRAKDEQGKW